MAMQLAAINGDSSSVATWLDQLGPRYRGGLQNATPEEIDVMGSLGLGVDELIDQNGFKTTEAKVIKPCIAGTPLLTLRAAGYGRRRSRHVEEDGCPRGGEGGGRARLREGTPGSVECEPLTQSAHGGAVDLITRHPGPSLALTPPLACRGQYIGMTFFVLIGCGSAMANGASHGTFEIALSFGMAIFVLASAIGHHSGGQMNCAVTLCLCITGDLPWQQGAYNFVAQLLGSITASFLLAGIFSPERDLTKGFATNSVAPGFTALNAFLAEIVGTFLLCYVVMEAAVNPVSDKYRTTMAIGTLLPSSCPSVTLPLSGFSVFLAHSVMIPVDGCSINPTRTIGPISTHFKPI